MDKKDTENVQTQLSFVWNVAEITWIGTGSQKMHSNTRNNQITFETDLLTGVWQTIENLDNYFQIRKIAHNLELSCCKNLK